MLSDTTRVDQGCRAAGDSSRYASQYTYYIKSADRQEKIFGYSNGLEAILACESLPSIDQKTYPHGAKVLLT